MERTAQHIAMLSLLPAVTQGLRDKIGGGFDLNESFVINLKRLLLVLEGV